MAMPATQGEYVGLEEQVRKHCSDAEGILTCVRGIAANNRRSCHGHENGFMQQLAAVARCFNEHFDRHRSAHRASRTVVRKLADGEWPALKDRACTDATRKVEAHVRGLFENRASHYIALREAGIDLLVLVNDLTTD